MLKAVKIKRVLSHSISCRSRCSLVPHLSSIYLRPYFYSTHSFHNIIFGKYQNICLSKFSIYYIFYCDFSNQSQARGNRRLDFGGSKVGDNLKKYSVDLTEMARTGKLDPVIGRDEETNRTIEILSRRQKNNPVLIGEAGVGKTAIVEGLALRIIDDEVPDTIKNRRVMMLDLPALIAGAVHRGEFEDRFKSVLRDVEALHDVILFVDEVHMLVGAGSSGTGAMDASNMLKPALARGVLHFVGATTLDEYRMHIEKDSALTRRFQTVYVAEPDLEDTISILRGIKEKYELHHSVEIPDSVVVSCAQFAQRYLTDRKLPDTAIDLLDEATSTLRMKQESKPQQLSILERKMQQLQMEYEALNREKSIGTKEQSRMEILEKELKEKRTASQELNEKWEIEKSARNQTQSMKEKLESVRIELDNEVRNGNYRKAGELKHVTIPDLERQLLELKESANTKEESMLIPDAVSINDVALVVERHSGVPIHSLLMAEKDKLLQMEDQLSKSVVAQSEAAAAIANCIRVSRTGLHAHNKPTGVFLFLGPSGVGKTEMVKSLANFLFDDPNAMVRIDMTEYMEKHSVSRLIGAPPGYVGYKEGGMLTEAVRRRPYQIVLLDEVEKAHKQVTNILLQVFDEGHLTDGQGRKVNFRNCILIMTSNLGASELAQLSSQISKTERRKAVIQITENSLRNRFPPEFINRIDEIIPFNPLQVKDLIGIVDIHISHLNKRIEDKDIQLQLSEDVKEWLAQKGYDINYGARPLERIIMKHILRPLSIALISEDIAEQQKNFCRAKPTK